MAIVFSNTPPPNRKITLATDAISQLPAFNTIYRAAYDYLETNDLNSNELAAWRKDFREGVINVGGRIPDIDFFRTMMGGTSREIEGTDYYVKYDGALDFNVYADADSTGTYGAVTNAYYEQLQNGTYTGNYASFSPIADSYTNNGTYNPIFVGMGLTIYNDQQEVVVIKIDKTTPYAWVVYVAPLNGSYVPQIYGKQAMAIRPATRTTGYADVNTTFVNTPWATVGYIDKIQPMEFYGTWEQPQNLDRGYQEVVQFAFLFDNVTGQEISTWHFKAALEKRNEMVMASTNAFFFGQRNTNSALTQYNYNGDQFNGFDGLMPIMFYGGGNVYIVDNTYGFSLDYDYMNIVFTNDAQKKSDELLMLKSKRFGWQMELRNAQMFKENSGACMFKTFERMGADQGDIKRYGIDSYHWSNNTLHTREVGAWTDNRFFGNNYVQDLGFIMPGYGMTDSLGNQVGPVEFYRQKGTMMSSEWDEVMENGRTTSDQATKWFGNIRHRIQMAVHGRENMYALMPQYVQ